MIDHVIYAIILVLPFNLWLFHNITEDTFTKVFSNAFPILMLVAFVAYACKDLFGGRSIGKRILGLYTRDYFYPDELPKLYRLIVRNLLVFIWPVEYIVLSRDKEGKRLGDKLAKTIVLEKYSC